MNWICYTPTQFHYNFIIIMHNIYINILLSWCSQNYNETAMGYDTSSSFDNLGLDKKKLLWTDQFSSFVYRYRRHLLAKRLRIFCPKISPESAISADPKILQPLQRTTSCWLWFFDSFDANCLSCAKFIYSQSLKTVRFFLANKLIFFKFWFYFIFCWL